MIVHEKSFCAKKVRLQPATSVQIARSVSVVDDAGSHPGDGIDVKRRKSHRTVAKDRVEPAGMARAEISSPNRGAVVGVGKASRDDRSLVLIGQRRKVIPNDTFVPASVVPAFV